MDLVSNQNQYKVFNPEDWNTIRNTGKQLNPLQIELFGVVFGPV